MSRLLSDRERIKRLEEFLGLDDDAPKRGAWGIGQIAAGHIDIVQFSFKTPTGRFSCKPLFGSNNHVYVSFWPFSDAEVKRLISEGCPLNRGRI